MRIKEILEEIDFISANFKDDMLVENIFSIDDISNKKNALTWCSDKNKGVLSTITTESIIIISDNIDQAINNKLNFLVVKNPRRAFQTILQCFFVGEKKTGINSSAIISKKAKIGKDVFIGHNVVIEEDCVVGNNSYISHNTIILKGTIIGEKVTIGCNNTIAGTGFGYEKNQEGDFELIPHIGNVVIKNNVDIGNNVCIDRAVLGSTVVNENVKIDNQVHIAHGVKVGKNSILTANAMIAGSVTIGDNSWIAPSASIINKKNVGSNTIIGIGAVVTKNVQKNSVVTGNPARLLRKIT